MDQTELATPAAAPDSQLSVERLKIILEAALLAAGEAMPLNRLQRLFEEGQAPDEQTLCDALDNLAEDYHDRAIELVRVASGYRLQVRASFAEWVNRLWEERPGQYSRALLETLALIAYRQPITRGEISDVRGVAVSTPTIKTLQERGWVRIVGHREAPGRPALYGTTREFLDYFNLRSLSELPPLAEPRDLGVIGKELMMEDSLNAEGREVPTNASGEALSDAPPTASVDSDSSDGFDRCPESTDEAASDATHPSTTTIAENYLGLDNQAEWVQPTQDPKENNDDESPS